LIGRQEIESIEYENRFVAFIDIIGWSAANARLTDSVRAAVSLIHDEAAGYSDALKRSVSSDPTLEVNPLWLSVQVGAFSDNIVISHPANMLGRILFSAGRLAHGLLKVGFLCRGGISFGLAYHKDSIVLGPALIEAVRLEKEASLPRILLGNSAIVELRRTDSESLDHGTITDILGRTVVNPMLCGARFAVEHQRMYREMLQVDLLEESISAGLRATADTPPQLEKWRYARDMLERMQARGLELAK
jgi:hypothetical protein